VDRSPRRPSGVRLLAAAAAATALIAPWTLHAGASEPSQRGWWNRASQDVSTPLGQLPAAPAPDVPDDGLPVGATFGEPVRATGIGMMVDAAPGAAVEEATLTLVEDSSFGGDAEIVACPILEFWVDGPNQPYDSMPAVDCDRAVIGERSDDGTWVFDLTPIAADWLDLASGIDPNGVALLPGPRAPPPSRSCSRRGAPRWCCRPRAVIPTPTRSAPPAPTPAASTSTSAPTSGSTPTSAAAGSTAGGSPRPTSGPVTCRSTRSTRPHPTAPPTTGAAPVTPPTTAPRPLRRPRPARPMGLGELPGAAWLLLPAALVLAGVTSYALGPAGEPVAAAGGRTIARALSTRSRLEVS
jgi:hypothetical protein